MAVTTVSTDPAGPVSATSDRRRYQREVEALLETIRARVADLERSRAFGVRGGGLAAAKRDLAQARSRLAELVRRGTAQGDAFPAH